MLELGSKVQQQLGLGKLGKDGLCDPQGMWAGMRKGCNWSSVAALGRRVRIGYGGTDSGDRSSVGLLPGFLAGVKRVFNNSTQKAEVENCWDFQMTSLFCVARPCPRERKERKRKELDICLVCGVFLHL